MSTRVIASIGVVLCAAMTSFSIYLGVIEHVYTHQTTTTHVFASASGRSLICEKLQPASNTTTTSGTDVDKNVTCHPPSHSTE